MRVRTRPRRRLALGLLAICVLAAGTMVGPASAASTAPAAVPDGAREHILAVLQDPEVARHVRAWGLTTADVRHDVEAMSAGERARLALVLGRRWHHNPSYSQAQQQAQFLVTVSLMRESALFASVISTGASRLLR